MIYEPSNECLFLPLHSPASRQNPTTTKRRNSVQQLISKFSSFFENFPLDQLKLLESAKDISEFQGILGALISDNKEGGENIFDMIYQLKDRYAILHGILRGLIAKTEDELKFEPTDVCVYTAACVVLFVWHTLL